MLFTALAPGWALASGAHFLVIGSNLHLFSDSADTLKEQCEELQRYAEFYARRNQRPFSFQADRCSKLQKFDLRDSHANTTFPTYASKDEVQKKVAQSPGYVISVGTWLPGEIWRRFKDQPQDGVCYNTALVESGILPESARSSFLTSIEYFLGMRGLKEYNLRKNNLSLHYGPLSDSPLVESKKTWEISAQNRETLRQEITKHLRAEFSPGSVLCVSIDDKETKETLRKMNFEMLSSEENKELKVISNIEALPESYESESKGGHCLVFLTPSLISESNLRLPKNLVNWNIAYDFYFNLIVRSGGNGRFHYFRINTERAIEGKWVKAQVDASPRMQKLMALAIQHRSLYESLDWKPCLGSNQVNLYSANCSTTNRESIKKLKLFWQTEGAALQNAEFAEFRSRLNESDQENSGHRWNIEQAASELFREMWELRERVLSSD